jgi:hypothetical protein
MNDRNPSDLEQRLRRAMQPVDPPGGFSERLMARLARAPERSRASPLTASNRGASNGGASSRAAPNSVGSRPPWRYRRRVWLPDAAVAAFAAVLIGTGLWSQQRTLELRAREARTEVFQALRISSQALNAALHVTVEPGRSG